MTAYTTAFEIKFYSQVTYEQLEMKTDGDYENVIDTLIIPAAQKIVDNYCHHDFNNNNGTLTLDGSGKKSLILAAKYRPLISVSSVTIDGTAITDHKVYDHYISRDSGTFTKDEQNVVVICNYGYASVPDDVNMVCALIGANFLRQMLRSKTMPDMITPLMEAGGGASLGAIMASPVIFTKELKNLLLPYVFMDVEAT